MSKVRIPSTTFRHTDVYLLPNGAVQITQPAVGRGVGKVDCIFLHRNEAAELLTALDLILGDND